MNFKKIVLILILQLLFFSFWSQGANDPFEIILPREVSWGKAWSKGQSYGVFYASCHAGFFQNSEKLENLLVGFSYSRLNKENHFGTSIILEANTDHWFDLCKHLKVEPLFNVDKHQFDFVNVEIGVGCCLGISAFTYIPVIPNPQGYVVGFKAGFFLPFM